MSVLEDRATTTDDGEESDEEEECQCLDEEGCSEREWRCNFFNFLNLLYALDVLSAFLIFYIFQINRFKVTARYVG